MSRYIEINGKIVRYNKITKRRKTRRRGGGFEGTECNFTPIQEISFEDLKMEIQKKTRYPIKKWNLKSNGKKYIRGTYNIVTDVECINKSRKRKSINETDIVCRILKNPFFIGPEHEQQVTFINSSDDVIDKITREIIIQLQQKDNSLAIYDIQAIPIYHSILSNLTSEEINSEFGLSRNYESQLYVLCIVMERGEPYILDEEHLKKTMTLFELVAKKHICIDVKPANLLCIHKDVKMIDFDPDFVKETAFFSNITDPIFFGSCVMKYLFCIFLIIFENVDIKDTNINKELTLLTSTTIQLTNGTEHSFMFIMSSLYSNNSSIFTLDFISTQYNFIYFMRNFTLIIDKYHFIDFMRNKKTLLLFIQIRKYLIDCKKKADYEYRCLNSSPNFKIKYDMATQSLRYYQCRSNFFSFFNCQNEIYNIEFSIDENNLITFSYTNNENRESETFQHSWA